MCTKCVLIVFCAIHYLNDYHGLNDICRLIFFSTDCPVCQKAPYLYAKLPKTDQSVCKFTLHFVCIWWFIQLSQARLLEVKGNWKGSEGGVKVTIVLPHPSAQKVSSLSLPPTTVGSLPFHSLSLQTCETCTYYFVSSLETLCFSRKNKVFPP